MRVLCDRKRSEDWEVRCSERDAARNAEDRGESNAMRDGVRGLEGRDEAENDQVEHPGDPELYAVRLGFVDDTAGNEKRGANGTPDAENVETRMERRCVFA